MISNSNMNIEGLDYNTQREKLVLPEYGRGVQNMVDHCINIKDREERQNCAEAIIAIMDRMFPENRESEDHDHKLWDNLAIMSNFQLDVDFPYDIADAHKIATKPEPMEYPMQKIPVRHYGSMMFELFDRLKTMEPGQERDELIHITANQMKRNLILWSHGSCDNEKVASDLARYTDGKIQIDLETFKFDEINERDLIGKNQKKK
jgi:hypothetical protein